MSGGSYVKLLLLLVIHFCNTDFGNFSTIRTNVPANITNDVITKSNGNSTDIKQADNLKILVFASPDNTTNKFVPFKKRRSNRPHKIKSFFITTFVFEPQQRERSASDKNASNEYVVEKTGILEKMKDAIIKSSQLVWETIANAFKPARKVIIIRNTLPCHKSLTIDAHVCNEDCAYRKLYDSRATNGHYSIMDALATPKEDVSLSTINNATATLSEEAKTKTTLNQLGQHEPREKSIATLKINFPYLGWFWKRLESINNEPLKSKSPTIDDFLSDNMSLLPASEQTNNFSRLAANSRKKRNSDAGEFETENRDRSSPENNTVPSKTSFADSSSKPNAASFATNESELKKATFLNEPIDLMALDGYVPVVTDKNVPYIQADTKISEYLAKKEDYGHGMENKTPLFLIVTIPSLIAIVTFVVMIYYFTKDNGLCCQIFQLRSTSSEMGATKRNHIPTADLPPN